VAAPRVLFCVRTFGLFLQLVHKGEELGSAMASVMGFTLHPSNSRKSKRQ
jgi:hypothetical protein